eukprot:gene2976-1958_t
MHSQSKTPHFRIQLSSNLISSTTTINPTDVNHNKSEVYTHIKNDHSHDQISNTLGGTNAGLNTKHPSNPAQYTSNVRHYKQPSSTTSKSLNTCNIAYAAPPTPPLAYENHKQPRDPASQHLLHTVTSTSNTSVNFHPQEINTGKQYTTYGSNHNPHTIVAQESAPSPQSKYHKGIILHGKPNPKTINLYKSALFNIQPNQNLHVKLKCIIWIVNITNTPTKFMSTTPTTISTIQTQAPRINKAMNTNLYKLRNAYNPSINVTSNNLQSVQTHPTSHCKFLSSHNL